MLIVNNVGNKKGVSVRDISDILKRPVLATIPSDEPAASTAADRGYPLVSGPAQKRPIALALVKLAEQTAEILESEELDEDGAVAGSRFGKLFGNR
jgi:Flp pilus assembly CpaE family ATPase